MVEDMHRLHRKAKQVLLVMPCLPALFTHLGFALAEVLLGPAVHAGDASLAVEVHGHSASRSRRLHLVNPACRVALLVAG